MARYISPNVQGPGAVDLTPLPVADWKRMGLAAPKLVPVAYTGPAAALPSADVVIVTWTTAEWSALDHVFVDGRGMRLPGTKDWDRRWFLYAREAPPMPVADVPAGSPVVPPALLWGYYQLVEVTATGGRPVRVLLFKSNTHLQHPPGLDGVKGMVEHILEDVRPRWIYSLGTAGGARQDQRLGDVVITNAAQLELQKALNEKYRSWTKDTYRCDAFPSTDLVESAQQQLLFRMSSVVSFPALESMLSQLHSQVAGSEAYGLDNLVDDRVDPRRLHEPAVQALRDVPLLSTDYYYIAKGDDAAKYAFLEMDDAVIARLAGERRIKFTFVRNISDPIVPDIEGADPKLVASVRSRWSGLTYERFGFFSSYNGAVVTFATIAAMEG